MILDVEGRRGRRRGRGRARLSGRRRQGQRRQWDLAVDWEASPSHSEVRPGTHSEVRPSTRPVAERELGILSHHGDSIGNSDNRYVHKYYYCSFLSLKYTTSQGYFSFH